MKVKTIEHKTLTAARKAYSACTTLEYSLDALHYALEVAVNLELEPYKKALHPGPKPCVSRGLNGLWCYIWSDADEGHEDSAARHDMWCDRANAYEALTGEKLDE